MVVGATGVVPDRLQLPGEQDRPHTQPDPECRGPGECAATATAYINLSVLAVSHFTFLFATIVHTPVSY